jgi:hypothetical protein
MMQRLYDVVVMLAVLAAVPAAACNDPATLGIDLSQQGQCDPIVPERCLLPFPNDYFTVPDGATHTRRRVHFEPDALPKNTAGTPLDAAELGQSDGFSPGSALLLWSPTPRSSSSTLRRDDAGRCGPSST